MGSFIAKQPNGLYCRFSYVVDCPTDWNMTEDDYIEMCAEKAREQARYVLKNRLGSFDTVIEDFIPINMSKEEFDNFLKETSEVPIKEK